MSESTLERTPKVPNSPPDPVIISWSGLKRWENCPQHQLRVIKRETDKQSKGRIFLPGTVCDLTMRRFLESDDPQRGMMEAVVEEVLNETVEKAESKIIWRGNPNEDKEQVKKFCRESVKRLEPWLFENVLPYDYQPELKFKAFMEIPYVCNGEIQNVRAPLKMIGGIDILVRDDQEKFRLYDLKITKDPSYLRSTLAQLIFYDLAWALVQENFDHANDWGFVCPALPELFVPIKVTQDDRRVMMSRISQYAQGVWADSWAPKGDDTGCNWCEARGVCEKFKLAPILESNGKQRVSFAEAAAQRAKFRS